MPKTMDEFIKDFGKPKTVKEHVVYGWNWTKRKVHDGIKWVVENPQEAAVLGTIVTGVTAGLRRIAKSVDRNITARREQYCKERYVYDHSTGRYLKTRKVLSQEDTRRINQLRQKNPGMKMSEALERLNLLD